MSGKPKTKVEVITRSEASAKHSVDRTTDLTGLCHSLFEGSPLPTAMVTGASHLVQYVNPAFSLIAGKSKEELMGKAFTEIIPSDGCRALLDHVYRTGEAES